MTTLFDYQMRFIAAALSALFTIGLCQGAWAGPEDEVHAWFEQWIATFNSHDADRLSQLYDQNARLLSTGGKREAARWERNYSRLLHPIYETG